MNRGISSEAAALLQLMLLIGNALARAASCTAA